MVRNRSTLNYYFYYYYYYFYLSPVRRKSVANTYEPVYLTTTVLNKQSVPYFITQTQNVSVPSI